MEAKQHGEDPPNKTQPMPVLVAKATTHCGSGCTLGDLVAEWVILALPLSILGHKLFGARSIKEALKADSLSLTAWQVGMYGWMAIATFVIFKHELHQTSPVFWFMMQLGMVLGFITSYPINWWIIQKDVKEKM